MDSQSDNVVGRPSESSIARNNPTLEPEVSELLRFELNSALLQFVQAERPVVLEGLGIITPERKKTNRTHLMGSWGIVREEILQSLTFEKCEDTSCLPSASYSRIVDTRELVQSIYSRLPLAFQLRWSERELRRLLVQFIREVKTEVTESGFTDQLRGLGHLYAIHNRQGDSLADWFAGADMFIVPRQLRPLSLGSAHRFPRPILENGWELWEATCGSPAVWSGTFSLRQSLRELGFPEDVVKEHSFNPDSFRVALFRSEPSNAGTNGGTGKKDDIATFVTDGLRVTGKSDLAVAGEAVTREAPDVTKAGRAKHKLRHELVLRVPYSAIAGAIELGSRRPPGNSVSPPAWIVHALAAGALLLASDRVNPLRANAALALGRTLTGSSDCKLRSELLVPCAQCSAQQLSVDGPFHYVSVLGITRDEASVLATHGREHLLAVLEARGFAQITYPTRSSSLLRSHLAPVRSRQLDGGKREGNHLTKSFATSQTVPM